MRQATVRKEQKKMKTERSGVTSSLPAADMPDVKVPDYSKQQHNAVVSFPDSINRDFVTT